MDFRIIENLFFIHAQFLFSASIYVLVLNLQYSDVQQIALEMHFRLCVFSSLTKRLQLLRNHPSIH